MNRAVAAAAGAAAIIAVDQLVKTLVRSQVPEGSAREIVPGVDLVHTKNSGVSFGFLADAPPWVVGLVSTVALFIVVGVVARMVPGRAGVVAAALIVGGAVGNLIDRILFGAVTDFLDLPLLPPCNVADIAITFGAIAMAIGLLLEGVAESRAAAEAEGGDPA
ncbi:MAG: signal peptidase II [Solirubrobacteraceae bacterium]|nr:signal peptidase II [Solirubrobacteraceae bacterium]